jgi:DNA topoisomerase-1
VSDSIRVYAGACTVTYNGAVETEAFGRILTIVKPDGTVLVHDESGYQPAAWLTRAEAVNVDTATPLELTATSGDQSLRVVGTAETACTTHPVTPSGPTIGDCPSCTGTLIRAGGDVVCTGCGERWSLPADATVLDAVCPDCDLPRMTADRGAPLEACLDPGCQSLAATARDRFEGAWDCPQCGGTLSIRSAASLLAGCAACGEWYPIPTGTATGTCPCGLPQFRTPQGLRCLDAGCGQTTSSETAP